MVFSSLAFLACIYFCLRKTASSSKGSDTFTDWAFPANIAQRQPFATNGEIYKYIYIYTQYKTNILKCFYPIDFSNLVVRVVHLFLFVSFFFFKEKKTRLQKMSFFDLFGLHFFLFGSLEALFSTLKS